MLCLFLSPFLNQARAHSQLKASCGRAPGLLKLFYEKCVFVCLYICLSVRTHVSKALEAKSSLYTRNNGYTEPVLNL